MSLRFLTYKTETRNRRRRKKWKGRRKKKEKTKKEKSEESGLLRESSKITNLKLLAFN